MCSLEHYKYVNFLFRLCLLFFVFFLYLIYGVVCFDSFMDFGNIRIFLLSSLFNLCYMLIWYCTEICIILAKKNNKLLSMVGILWFLDIWLLFIVISLELLGIVYISPKTSMASHVYDTLEFITTKHLSRLEERPIKRKRKKLGKKLLAFGDMFSCTHKKVDESSALSLVCVCIREWN